MPISKHENGEKYNSILIMVDKLTKILHCKLIKTTINTIRLVNVIIQVVIKYYSHLNFIVNNQNTLFKSDHFYIIFKAKIKSFLRYFNHQLMTR